MDASRSVVRSSAQFGSKHIILIGASTGGVDALINFLSKCPVNSPPILIVQHTGTGFAQSLARLLDKNAPITVKSAEHGERLQSGFAYLSPSAETHLCVSATAPFRCVLKATKPQGGHRPSVDALFYSAVPHASFVAAAILTGMGRDGAEGLLALRQAGARTFAQDQASSVVHSMPLAAKRLGAVEREVGIDAMASNLLETCLSHNVTNT